MTDRYDNKQIVVFDLDGTLADAEHRRHFIYEDRGAIPEVKPDWDAFYDACDKDVLIPSVYAMWNHLRISQQFSMWIVTGRSERVFNKTVAWLFENAITPDRLIMRDVGDRTTDAELKWQWMEEYKDRILCVFEDRQRVVDMWRENGVTCFQVAEGDF